MRFAIGHPSRNFQGTGCHHDRGPFAQALSINDPQRFIRIGDQAPNRRRGGRLRLSNVVVVQSARSFRGFCVCFTTSLRISPGGCDCPRRETKKADVVEPLLGIRPRRLTRQRAPRGRAALYLVIRLVHCRPALNPGPHLFQSIAFSQLRQRLLQLNYSREGIDPSVRSVPMLRGWNASWIGRWISAECLTARVVLKVLPAPF